MPVTGFHARTATGADDPLYDVQLQRDWNASHLMTLNAVGSEVSGAFANGGGVTFGLSADGFMTAAAPAGVPSPVNFSAGTTSNNLGSVVFGDANGLAFQLDGSTITGSYTQSTHSHATPAYSGSNASFTAATVTFGSSNGMHFYTTNGSMVGSYTVPTVTNSSWTVSDNATSGTVARLAFTNQNGVTLSLSTGAGGSHTIVGSHNALTSQSTQFLAMTLGGNTAGTTTFHATNNASLFFNGGNNITLSGNGSTVTISAASQTVQTQPLSVFATSNTTQSTSGTMAANSLLFNGAGIASVGVSNGSVIISVPAGGGGGDGGVFAGVSTAGNTAGSTGTVSTGNFVLVGTGGVSLSQSTGAAGSAATVTISAPASSSLVGINGISLSTAGSTISVLPQWNSSYENMEGLVGLATLTFNAASVSYGVGFMLPWPISASFIRLPVLMTTNSTTIATIASATATASGAIFSTWNAVIYSLGVGGNSKSLQSVASGSAGFTFRNSISITNSTQYSITQGFSAQANGAGTTRTTQYSISNTNYSFTTNQIATEWSSNRLIDIPFANSLSGGVYWGVFGLSTSSASAGAGGLAALTNCNVRYSNHYGASQTNLSFGIMGSTNLTSGGLMGAGSFSTAGGGTTNSIPISAISSGSNLVRMYFQMLRSA